MAVSFTLKAALVPRIETKPDGLSVRVGLRQHFLSWRQISEITLRRTQRGSFAAVYWQPAVGGALKGLWLNYPFPVDSTLIVRELETRLNSARTRGAGRPDAPKASSEDPARIVRMLHLLKWSGAVAAAVFVGWVIDINAARTALVTPVPVLILRTAQIVSVSLMACPIILLLLLARMQRSRPTPTSALVLAAAIFGGTVLAFGMVIADDLAKRITEVMAFHNSSAQFSAHYFRIVNFGRGKGGAYAEIEPYPPSESRLPVSKEDYERLRAADQPNEASIYCYPLMAQTTGGAVRIGKPVSNGAHKPEIMPCPKVTDDRWR